MDTQRFAVRYIVEDVDEAIAFYTSFLGFELKMHSAPGFAALGRGPLTLFVNRPGAGSAGQDTPRGTPAPGGWNRFQLQVDDLDAVVERLVEEGAPFDGEPTSGAGGRQALLLDPSGNCVELFEAAH